ncbi:hypothetical protein [Cerasicoccus maritimus]|uniref:hypothetical protein n=1 Tax=Cerasicoccus maritimus TaxID=490089 RepID=UPI0028527979|nr:hypothetical protein [Cerasicoccus maritimus]
MAQNQELQVAEGVAKVLPGFQFNKRLAGRTDADHILLFSKGRDVALVTWTTGAPKNVIIPANPATFSVFNTKGELVGEFFNEGYALQLFCGDIPAIFVPKGENQFLQVAALAERIPGEMTLRGPQLILIDCEFVNPMDKPLVLKMPGKKSVALKSGDRFTISEEVEVGRSFEPMYVPVGASGVYQMVKISVDNPLMIDVRANLPGKLTVDIINPAGDPFSGRMALSLLGSDNAPFEFPVDMAPRETIKTLEVPLGIELPLPAPIQLSLTQYIGDPRREITLTETSALQFVNVPGLIPGADQTPAGWKLHEMGDVFGQVRAGQPPSGAPWGSNTAMIAYKFEEPGAVISLKPLDPASVAIADLPSSLGMWINGDRSGNLISVRWRDGQGKLFQPKPRKIDWSGWRYETFATDGMMQPPLTWDSLVHLESADKSSGAIMVSGPVFNYQSEVQRTLDEEEDKTVEVVDDISFGDAMKIDPTRQLDTTKFQQVPSGTQQ